VARRSAIKSTDRSKFTEELLRGLARDLESQRTPVERMTVSDDRVIGLRAMVSKTGAISFHVSYHVGGKRPLMHIGDLNKDSPDYISINDAREVAETIKYLASEYAIDPQEGMMRRVVKELKRDGTRWRPK
jgi:hypothetical protein